LNGRVTCTVEQRIAVVELSRPEKLNALDSEMFTAIVDAGRSLLDRDEISVVVLKGRGRAFCAGLDVSRFERMGKASYPDLDRDDAPLGAAAALSQEAAHVWSLVPVPVIAAIHGVAFGGGLQIALGADIRVVAPDARLAMREILWGLVPDMSGTQLLPELVGRDVAKELVFTGREVSGAEAHALGLATILDADPVARATSLAREIASMSRSALIEAKRLLELAGRIPLAEGLAEEQASLSRLRGSEEQQAAVRLGLKRLRR
jgi:enoyl-CoA hydratase/carnithine racemase